MGKIIKDIVVKGPAEEVIEQIFTAILSKPEPNVAYRIGEVDLAPSCFGCRVCGRDLARVLRSKEGEIHIVSNPCTRIVAGIHPEIGEEEEKRFGRKVPFVSGEARYFCAACYGLKTPERIWRNCNPEVKELIGNLHQDPICHMWRYDPKRGCWITVTEFPFNWNGRFMNLQTDFNEFVIILDGIGLVPHRLLIPFLPSR